MKAKMKTNLIPRYTALSPDIIDFPDEETQRFLLSIEGRDVELVFIGPDAFEKEDNDFWLPACLWDATEEES